MGHRLVEGRTGWRYWQVPLANWLYYGMMAWLTPRLLALGAVGVALPLGLLAFGIESAITRLGFAGLALALAAIVTAWWWRPRLEVRGEQPVRVERGRAFPIRYVVHNTGRRAACDVTLDTLPYPNPAELRMRGVRLPSLGPGLQCVLEGQATARRRGRYRLAPLRWDTDFPLGLWRHGKTDWADRRLTVYPAHSPLTSLDIPMGARHRLDTHSARQLTRSALEFHGCREFRAGDALRHLHPRSSARAGVPVIKEFQAEGRGRTAIVVDTWARLPSTVRRVMDDQVVEACLSLATAVTEHLSRSDRVLELLAAGPGLYRFESAGRSGFLEEVLDILASVDPVDSDPLPRIQPVLMDEIRAIQSVCLILGRWDRQRADLVRELAAWQVGVKVILVTWREVPLPVDLPEGAVCVSARRVRRGEVVAL